MRVIHWNGHDLPDALRDLPPGTYVVERVDDFLALTPEEDAGLVQALASLRAGEGVPHAEVRAQLLRQIRREGETK